MRVAVLQVPVGPAFRKPHPSKPELFVLADIAGLVSTFAAFTLQLAFAVPRRAVLPGPQLRVRGRRGRQGDDVLQQAPDTNEVARHINAAAAGVWLDGRSDYGHALSAFWDIWGEQVRRRTTVIVLGDARTNYHDPREGALKAVTQLAMCSGEPGAHRRVEQRRFGDRPLPAVLLTPVHQCRNIRQLRAFVEDLD